MIDINRLTAKDIGREVVYHPGDGSFEFGHITSWNDKWIFVRYAEVTQGIATKPEQLMFTHPDGDEQI